jgi:transposase
MKLSLSADQQQELIALHRQEDHRRFADRIKALLLLDEHWRYEEVAKVLLLDDQTIRNYETCYLEQGLDVLLSTHYQGGVAKLSGEQEGQLKEHLTKTIYLTTSAIIAYVQQTYEVTYSVAGMTHLLHRWDFVYKKAALTPGKIPDPQKQREWVDNYAELKATPEAEILFMDGVHPHHNPIASYGWMPKGERKEIPSNTGRQRLNLNGAVNPQTLEVIIRDDPTINAQSTIALLQQIETTYPLVPVIYVISDNACYYYCRLVTDFLAHSRIKMIRLPAYSPNLNLIERLWKFFKKKVLYNHYYETFDSFKQAVLDFFRGIKIYHQELASLLTENFHIIEHEFSKT